MAAVAPGTKVPGASARPDDLDLDALRAERLEAVGERAVFFGGRRWVLVPEVPFELSEAWSRRLRTRVAELLLADPGEAAEFMACKPSNTDFDLILESYGTTPGKSSAS